MNNLIIHVLQHRPKGDFLNRCLDSLYKEAVPFCVIPNEGKTILEGRYAGCDVDATHVSYVDDDDELLLTADTANELINLNKPAIFTNSYIAALGQPVKLCVPKKTTQWTILGEKEYKCRPHQTTIFEKELAISLLDEVSSLCRIHGWDTNACDFILRSIVSTTIGWHYDPRITHRWHIHSGNHHKTAQSQFKEIRNYFFASKK